MDTVLNLISIEQVQDSYGVWRETLSPRQVFAEIHSITRNEFFEAGRNG